MFGGVLKARTVFRLGLGGATGAQQGIREGQPERQVLRRQTDGFAQLGNSL
jgi:hypothetical protein